MNNNTIKDVENRFWSHVDIKSIDDCWNWTGCTKSSGYGAFRIGGRKGKTISANKFAYEITKGEIPEKHDVCHKCDNRLCCNPNHLFVGTRKQNMIDCVNKNRIARGEKHGSSVLTKAQVTEIRSKYIPYKYSQFRLAKEYSVARTTIQEIIERRTWSHIP